MSIDTIGDFITIIRNGLMASKYSIETPYSKVKLNIVEVLKLEGFIRDFSIIEDESHKKIRVLLKYVNGESVIHELKRISRPGRRVYGNALNLNKVVGKLGVYILTTNQGIMTDKKAQELSIGGEVICSVW